MNTQSVYKTMLSEVHKLLQLYLTIPISWSTSERTFSALSTSLRICEVLCLRKSLQLCISTCAQEHAGWS